MDQRIFIAIAIIVGAGLIGGLAAALADEAVRPESSRRTYGRYLLLGVIASACVPLFLSLVRSKLTQDMFQLTADKATGQRFPDYYESYLVFIGICLIAAFSARRFIDSISKQVLQRLEEVRETAQGAAETAADARQVAHEAVSEVESADDNMATTPEGYEDDSSDGLTEELGPLVISDAERRALQALSKRTYRTRTGIAEDAGISRNRISEILDSLHGKKLAVPTTSPTTGGARWIITKRGEAALQGRP